MSMSHKASNLALHNRVCSIPEGGILFPFDDGLHGIDSAGNIIYPEEGAVATLRPGEGRFGGAIAVEEATTNLCVGLGGDSYNLNNFYSSDGTAFCEVVAINGKKWVRRPSASNSTSLRISNISISANTTYTWSFLVYADAPDSINCGQWDGISYGSKSYSIGTTPTRVIHTFTSKANSTYEIIHITNLAPSGNCYYFADFQLEKKPFATSFVEGSRASGRLVYSGIPEKNITVNFWWRSPHILDLGTGDQSGYPAIIQLGEYSTASRSLRLWLWAGGLTYFIGHHDGSGWMASGGISTNGPLIPNNFYMVTIVLQGGKNLKFYLDGKLGHERVLPLDLDSWGTNRLAIEPSASAHNNAMYDDLMILPYAASDQEIQSWYHSNSRIHNNADTHITL